MELVGFDELDDDDVAELHALIEEHHLRTAVAGRGADPARVGRDAAAVREGHAARLQARAARAGRGGGRRGGRAAREGGGVVGELGAFLRIERVDNPERDPRERTADFREFVITPPVPQLQEQGARCMECGVPFCHNGCPLGNLIPDWNDLVYRDRWREAIDQLHATNNFPEFTGKLCPAPCEAACVLEIREGDAVTIKQIEVSIINRAFDEGWVVPAPAGLRDRPHASRSIGAGPSGLAAAQQLRRARPRGHRLRARRGGRRARALRRAGLQDREVGRRAAPRPARGRGRALRVRRGRRGRRRRRRAARAPRRGRHRHRLARAARPAGPGPRARRRALRDGVPLRAQPLGGEQRRRRLADHRRRQARDRDRRRRHRRGLRRQLAPRGRRLGDPDRAARRAARRRAPTTSRRGRAGR